VGNAYFLNEDTYCDKVKGCWLGKNAGGTLGAPFEKIWGSRIPFEVTYYTQDLTKGAPPNDDLEIQLVWLHALEERGIRLCSRDLAEYWLNHIYYNPDEYGFHKMNLRLGLIPPISGWYNNPFKHNMGSPIRSEIWACISPGMPDVAAEYAWEDAVCDHAGGESVYGEIFNAAVQSAAFFLTDRQELLEIGLSFLPKDCKIALAVRTAMDAYRSGFSWLEAREQVMNKVFNLNAQYAPINLGFQTIAFLYGKDFGDALCKAVNCGWDTDCTAATVGATLGIINGASNLPEKWIGPLGKELTVTPPPGIDFLEVPKDVDELTARVTAIGRQVLASHPSRVKLTQEGVRSMLQPFLFDRMRITQLHERPQDVAVYRLCPLDLTIRYLEPDNPCISEYSPFRAKIFLRNRGGAPLSGTVQIRLPEGFTLEGKSKRIFELAGLEEKDVGTVVVTAAKPGHILTRNVGWVEICLEGRPAIEAVPLVMIGARKWLVSELIPNAVLETANFTFNTVDGLPKPENWRTVTWPGNELVVEPLFEGKPGVLGLLHYFKNPISRTVHISVPNNSRMELFVNGSFIKKTSHSVPCHPSFWGDCDPELQWADIHINTADVNMPEGWNCVFIKLERRDESVRAFLNLSHDPRLLHGCDDVEQTRFPWETED